MVITTIRQKKGRKVLFMKDYRYRVDRETNWCYTLHWLMHEESL